MSKKTVQEVFDLAISKGFYCLNERIPSSKYMCNSLEAMHRCSLLSDDEYLEATKEIKNYLLYLEPKVDKSYYCIFLYDALKRLGVLSKELTQQEAWGFLTSVYSDWGNRPLI